MLERHAEEAPLPVDERIQRVEAGEVLRRVDAVIEPPAEGQQLQVIGEDVCARRAR